METEKLVHVLALEQKSVQPYRTKDEYVWAMREDLAEWFNTLYGLDITAHIFFEQLETGVVLCRHANKVQSFILEQLKEGIIQKCHRGATRPLQLPEKGVQYRENVRPGTFQARDNISNFISWCRGLGLPDCLLFETEDLVLLKNERSVVLCLLEVARQGARYGMEAPMLVQLEAEIEAEIAGETPPSPPQPRITNDHKSLDEMVRELVSRCTCPNEFPMIRVSEGKYKIGDSKTLIFVRILRNHVMVRIGGGWDTLENYLDRHDPCRCDSTGQHSKKSNKTPVKRTMARSSSQGATNTNNPSGQASNHSSQIKSPSSESQPNHTNSTSHSLPSINPTILQSKPTTAISGRSTNLSPRSTKQKPFNTPSRSPVKSISSSPKSTTLTTAMSRSSTNPSPKSTKQKPTTPSRSPVKSISSSPKSTTPTPRPLTQTKSMSSLSTTAPPRTSRLTMSTAEATPKKIIQRGSNTHNPPKGQPGLPRRKSSSDTCTSKAVDDSVARTKPVMRRGHSVDTAIPQNSIMPKKQPQSCIVGDKKKKDEERLIISRNTEGKHSLKPLKQTNKNGVHQRLS